MSDLNKLKELANSVHDWPKPDLWTAENVSSILNFALSQIDQLEAAQQRIADLEAEAEREDEITIDALASMREWRLRAETAEAEIKRRDAAAGEPVLYALRFKNLQGVPYKEINDNCLFSSYDKARAYGRGGNYVTQLDGKIEWVPNAALDPEVIPLFTAAQPSALPPTVMKPIDLSECRTLWYEHDELSSEVECIPVMDFKKAIRAAGYQVEGE